MQYMNITENCSGRIDFSKTPDSIGLSISGLTTCTGIVILGEKGISVIHDEGYLSVSSIEDEFKFVGVIKEWSIFYNPSELKEKELNFRQKDMSFLIEKFQETYKGGEDSSFNPTLSGQVTLDKKTTSISEVNIAAAEVLQPPDMEKRRAIRMLNSFGTFCMQKQLGTYRNISVNIEFDSIRSTLLPSLIYHRKDIAEMIETEEAKIGERGVLKEERKYLEMCSEIPSLLTVGIFKKSIRPAPKIYPLFDKLAEEFEKIPTDELLLTLCKLGSEAATEYFSHTQDHEGANDYNDRAKDYLKLARKSDNTAIKAFIQMLDEKESEALKEKVYLAPS